MRALVALAASLALVATGLTTAAAPAEAFEAHRLEGPDRWTTAVEVDRAMDAAGGPVFLANGQKFPDALSAAPVVAAEGGHLLLTAQQALPGVVAERIAELAPSEIVIVGSEASISDAVVQQAVAAAERGGSRAEVARLGGAGRVETSLLLLERLERSGPVDEIWIASGSKFPDALVAASVAGRHHQAVVLDHHGSTPAAAEAWLATVASSVEGRHLAIAGGEPSVSAADALGLERVGAASVARFAGRDRYDTAREINAAWSDEQSPVMLLATGQDFPDALAGAALSAMSNAPMFLTPNGCHAAITPMLRDRADQLGVEAVVGLGSSATVSDAALRLEPCTTSLRQQIAQVYGAFPAQQHSGTGPRVIDLGRSISYAQVIARIEGSGSVFIHALDRDRGHLDTIGGGWAPYRGTSLLAPYGGPSPARYLRVEAQGSWTLEVRDLTNAPVLSGSATGSSDAVLLRMGPEATLTVSSGGSTRTTGIRQLYGYWQSQEPFAVGTQFPSSAPIAGGLSVIGVRAMTDSSWALSVR
ncbi:cell wall-binding repeat-containing protein [Agrococcus sp. BE272]|uniref:cell wall-binding repeat-containing protein n=1 Tax=Agrococcus sp. BE272 TaxID=2817727 RepID=UPI00285D6E2E|nr:cell wall-binding repeat-containing protein [Agrococcus sp. BE272]MDR7232897.1 putative cell wall-binding protein [Agrococcus sp. BE272]